jgi:UDP-3-O-[3-hydroxymyristoyl] glucosamine N-acyltransferase
VIHLVREAGRGPSLRGLAGLHGGEARGDAEILRVAPVGTAGAGDLAPLTHGKYARAALEASARGASILVSATLAERAPKDRAWVHAHAAWALARVLDGAEPNEAPWTRGEGAAIGPNVTIHPRVVLGKRVTIGAGSVIGAPGFGWATGPNGETRRVPQLGGVVIEDDVSIGALCTIDAGTLVPTRIRAGAKIDAQVHVGHNGDIGEGTIIAAQCGFAGSVKIGKGVLIGGQVGIGDHLTIGDGARIAGGSGIIADVRPGSVVAGYPAVPRMRWLRAFARIYRPGV